MIKIQFLKSEPIQHILCQRIPGSWDMPGKIAHTGFLGVIFCGRNPPGFRKKQRNIKKFLYGLLFFSNSCISLKRGEKIN
jgi:hypothetical protein